MVVLSPSLRPSAPGRVPAAQGARAGLSRNQRAALLLLALATLAAVLAGVLHWLLAVILGPLFLFKVALHLGTILEPVSTVQKAGVPLPAAMLPRYTVLVPLYREAAVLPRLLQALGALDYPAEQLEVFVLLEADDRETREALRGMALPGCMQAVVVPAGEPRTKPRALNHGLALATGELLAVYDAEDRPAPDQLLAAATRFHRLPRRVACLQARLSIDNYRDSLLSRLFAIEYAGLFDVTKPGLARSALPVPLGGTSNHFRVAALRALDGWDAWNVTEDADLGFRIARRGWLVADLASTTEEEAPATLPIWLNQRKRWVKGWMQTTVSHGHAPLATLAALGPVTSAAMAALSLGQVLSILLGPALGLAGLLWILQAEAWVGHGTGGLILQAMAIVVLTVGLLVQFVAPVLGLLRRKHHDLLPYVLLLPLYSMLISVAGWLAVVEYLRAPFRWNKTPHGLARTSRNATIDQKQASTMATTASMNKAVP
jgi:cellulose synthase/poly-beta-1,6-N-acetylglucosamine synthase-like glycosyltransferase